MAVQRIEEYRQKNGVDILKVYCKPTDKFPNGGYFYAPAEAIDVVNEYSWRLHASSNAIYVIANDSNTFSKEIVLFHCKLFEFYQGYIWNEFIDHISLCEFDNTDNNLNAVTGSQNNYNKISRGYKLPECRSSFRPRIKISGKENYPLGYSQKTEDKACCYQNQLEQIWLKEQLGTSWYMFDFKKYRRGSEDILDLERVGKISEEEATYRHILRYADNAWYMLRYGLEQYYKDNHISIPKYSLDTDGFMVHHITGQKLCPF